MGRSALTGTKALLDVDAHLAGISAGLAIVCARRLGNRDDALDATQETIARLLVCVREGRIICSSELAPVAYGIVRHVISDVLRARARSGEGDAAEAAAAVPNALEALVREEERRAVAGALDRLSPGDRDLLRRCFVDGEAIGRIAQELGEPAERVRKRKARALQRLGAALSRSKDWVTKGALAR
ncbi:MAG: RNA polymerase sigma factor [Gemmatimonadaceae bacterium]